MALNRTLALTGLLNIFLAGGAFSQEVTGPNPFAGNGTVAVEGRYLFRARCAGCHGADATGATGPNLVLALRKGISDERLFPTILRGVPNTAMPPMAGAAGSPAERETWKVITFLRSLGAVAGGAEAKKGPAQNIPWSELLDGLKNPQRWLTYSGDLRGQRHSPLTQITPGNVGKLAAQWTFQTGTPGKFEATAIVIDGTIYITGANNYAWAIDAKTGRQIWRYRRELPQQGLVPCCGTVNRGFAVLGGRLFMTTLDAHLLALDIRDGSVLWDSVLADYKAGYTATVAPIIVRDKVIVGVAGGEYGVRGSVDAFEATTGKRAWQFHTVPGPGEPGRETWSGDSWRYGGAPIWAPGSYDADTDTVFFGTGNPGPDYNGQVRLGDNLYSDSLLALDPETGRLKWHYQFTPHDTHDWDSTHTPVIADLRMGEAVKKVVMVANRNGFFYTLDRVTGRVLMAKPFVTVDWASGIGPDGRPVLTPGHEPNPQGTVTCPELFGGTNFMPTSFDPALGLSFVSVRERCQTYVTFQQEPVPGQIYTGGGGRGLPPGSTLPDYGALRAIDPATGERRWELRYDTAGFPGVLSTAAGLVFAGDGDGRIFAVTSKTGQMLWSYQLGWNPDSWGSGIGIFAGPSTFMSGGRQYVLMPSGTTLTAFALPE